MSGFEVASVFLGVLPLLIEAVKSYSSVSASLSTFRHYSREVKTVQRQLKVHHRIFLNECRLLLRLVEDEQGAKDMLDNELDDRWTDKRLNSRFRGVLKENFELCKIIVEACKEILDEIWDELRKFDVLKEKQNKNEPIKTTIRRLRDSIRITFEKSKYEKSINSLRDHNTELSTLRSHVGELETARSCAQRACISHKIVPTSISAIRTTSRGLHKALSAAWCCADESHGGHYAKICVEGEVQSWVRLDLAISSCHEPLMQKGPRYLSEPPIWLYVQSVGMDPGISPSIQQPLQTYQPSKKRSLTTESSQCVQITSTVQTSYCQSTSVTTQKLKKKKQVQFVEDERSVHFVESVPGTTSNAITSFVTQLSTPEVNLLQTKNICHYLKQNGRLCDASISSKQCVGYLESPQMHRYNFYLQTKHLVPNKGIPSSEQSAIFSIFDLMDQDVNDTLTVVDQLKLAHKTALATLQYSDTPWLQQRWRLKDLGYFGTRDVFDEAALQTLHLSSQISIGKNITEPSMEGVENAVALFSEEDYFGINNTTLFFLGVALLELGHWKPLESMKTQADPNEILTARRLASKTTSLGSRYQDIVRKCLRCDFGFGNDLNKKELQAAVYSDVVGQLEEMIKTLSI
ncbi:hypothetical protein B0J11DRAFT_442323 [Dendryphion nanum]|uniref:Fungal N-terminal domain-containing protein n=1 Tax=Dendryphion nanum TaxID=256645 RepID=A0A9P9DCB1_9PLEO|nr:hypothetical protein B0J11DRAFT_442323 [Dendryphion nanum]